MLELHYARRSKRRTVDLHCEVISVASDEPTCQRMTNISPYGAWVRTTFPLKIGERVVLSFKPPRWQGGELTVFAEVTRSVRVRERDSSLTHKRGHSGMGLEFIDLNGEQRRSMQRGLKGLVPAENRRQKLLRWNGNFQ